MALRSIALSLPSMAVLSTCLVLAARVNAQQSAVVAAGPTSAWMQGERGRFQVWMTNHPADVLIVPFQVNGPGFDPAERVLMANQLADALRSTTNLSIADPMLAGRAAGERLRVFSDAELQALAKRMKARFVIIGFAGHDQSSRVKVQIRVLGKDASGAWRATGSKTWDAIALSDERPPYLMIPTLAPAVADLLRATPASPVRRVASAVDAPGQLPRFRQLLAERAPPLNVHVAQLLAICYPRTPEAGVERAWIRSLRLAQASPTADTRLATARALFHLGRRPAALAALGVPKSDADHTLRAVLNGNLLEADARSRRISDPVLRLLAQVELRDLRVAYESEDFNGEMAALRALVSEDSDWFPFLAARVKKEGGRWGSEDFADSLSRFDDSIGEGGMVERAMKAMTAGLEQKDDYSVVFARSAFDTYDSQVRSANIAPAGDDDFRWLLLDLMQSQFIANLLAEGRATISTRDLPDEGHKLLARQQVLLRGHPDFEAMEAGLAWREYARWRGKQREHWQNIALARTRDAYALAGRTTAAIDRAERAAPWTSDIARQLQPVRLEHFWDWPISASQLSAAATDDRKAMHWYAQRATRYAVTEYSMLAWLAERELLADQKATIEKSAEGRFDGSPEYTKRRAANLLRANDVKGAEMVFRHYVEARLRSFGPYYEYLDLLVTQGRNAEGYRMFVAHPDFDPQAGASRVTLSNYAGLAAEYFWDIGRFEFAVPLIERSAGYDTGSNISMRSAAMVATWNRDPDRAARLHMQTARRYSDLSALSEYFNLIFALGRPDEAWRVYGEVHRDGNGGRVLSSIAKHARQIGWTEQQVIDWLANPKNAALADGTFFYAPRAALSAAIIDRDPVLDMPQLLARFPTPSPYVVDGASGKILRRADPSAPADPRPEICGPSRYGNGPVGGMAKVKRVDSSLVYFATGYQALARGRHADAFAAFDHAARLFEAFGTNCEAVSFMLPYLAISAAQTGNTSALRDYLRGVEYRDRNVNFNLVLAVFAAFEGRHADAEAHLDAALNRWTGSRYQVLPVDFIYADVLERLYARTQYAGYRNRLVAFVRVRQRVAPADAWPYAKEYRYSQVEADRIAALGMAHYLDPHSATLKGVTADEIAAAREQAIGKNPFVARRAKEPAPVR